MPWAVNTELDVDRLLPVEPVFVDRDSAPLDLRDIKSVEDFVAELSLRANDICSVNNGNVRI